MALLLACIGAVFAGAKKAPAKSASRNSPEPTVIMMPSKAKPLLDTTRIRKLYLDGDFEEAIEILDQGLKDKRPFDHHDSVFIFKHLGVMYAAKYETREKGKYYMHQLLATEPTARIMDMYASDMIYMIFKNIQDEFESTRVRLDRAEDHVAQNNRREPMPKQDPEPEPKASPGNKSGHAAVFWVGATAIAAAGVATYFIFSDEPKTTTSINNHSVP